MPDLLPEELEGEESVVGFPASAIDVALGRLYPTPDPHLNDPNSWFHDRLDAFLWSKQIEIAESVRDHRFTAVKACHGPGKSFTAGGLSCWWIDVHEPGSAFVVTTAPTWPQVAAILWREIRKMHRKGLPGRTTLECQWYLDGNELVAMGRKPADYDENAFQGIHARYVLVVVDEACGIPEQLWNAVDALATNEFARVLAIGNPDDPTSHFAEVCKPGSGWNVITISAFDTPNFTGEYIPEGLQHDLVSQTWVEERRKRWGEDSMLWTSKVLGEFPEITEETLITPAMISRAIAVDLPGLDKGKLGCDIARFGDDESVIYRNRGGQIRLEESWGKTDTMRSTGKIAVRVRQYGIQAIVDVVGIGAGVFDRLREQNLPATPFGGGERAFRKDRFINRRAEQYWTFRELMEADLIDLDPEDDKLLSQLQTVKYYIDSSGRIGLESKEDMKKRGFPSPDRADAAVMSTVHSFAPQVHRATQQKGITAGLLKEKM
jgi:hypothetical protein